MRILLVPPKRDDSLFEDIKLPPLDLVHPVAVLRKAGRAVEILDANL